jgi:hypothetical protein
MISPLSKFASWPPFITLLCVSGSVPALADEPTVVPETRTADTLVPLLKDILADPYRNFARYYGPDDCSSERVYIDTAQLLGKYADAPAKHQDALRAYIESDEGQCNCTRAIIGKDFDTLVDAVGSDITQVPCP